MRTSSRMASLKPSSVSREETSKCGYSQGTNKVGPRAASPSREKRETGGKELICAQNATFSLSHLSGFSSTPHFVPRKGETGINRTAGVPQAPPSGWWHCAKHSQSVWPSQQHQELEPLLPHVRDGPNLAQRPQGTCRKLSSHLEVSMAQKLRSCGPGPLTLPNSFAGS